MRIPSDAPAPVREAFREIWAALDPWIGDANIDFHGRRMINCGHAIQPNDYLTKAELTSAISGLDLGGGEAPVARILDLVRYGTHAQRLVLAPGGVPNGTLFYETDRAAIYQAQLSAGVSQWILLLCRPLRTADTKPADLTTTDAGFTWFDQVLGLTWRWSGSAWNYYLGSYVEVFANRPDPALADRGFLFIASDRGDQQWRKTGDVWVLQEGVGGPMGGTLSPDTKPSDLGTDDEGFLFFASDFQRTFRWNGTVWHERQSASDPREQIGWFVAAPSPGWAACDGATVTISTTSGGLNASYVTPNLTTAKRFLRAHTASGGTGGSATTHTHQVDPPSTTSGTNSASQEVQLGVGVTVAAHTHTHAVDIAAFASATPSGTGGDDALPPYYEAIAYIRL